MKSRYGIGPGLAFPAGLTLEKEIGRGAESLVYLASRGDELYAVKFYLGRGKVDDVMRRYRREASIHASLKSRAIPDVFEVGCLEEVPYIISEYIRGETLAERLARSPLDERTTIHVGVAIADALGLIHEYGLVHRDIKPGNILLASSGDIKLIDFGLAVHDVSDDTERVVGTFKYSAPEQAGMLQRPVDGRADLYALGAVLFECMAGHPPFVSENVGELLQQHAAVRPVRVDQLCVSCSSLLADIIDRLLKKDPDERYPSGFAVAIDLESLTGLEERNERSPGTQRKCCRVFVGREAELQALRRHTKSLTQGYGSIVFIQGPAGSGKSRLVHELTQNGEAEGILFLAGKCNSQDPYPFAPLREAIRRHLAHVNACRSEEKNKMTDALRRAVGHQLRPLVQFAPEFADVLGDPEGEDNAPATRDLFYSAIVSFLCNLADESGGATLWLDDIQWLDDASVELLALLGAGIRNHPLLLVLVARDDKASEARAAALKRVLPAAYLEEMSVEPLAHVHIQEIIGAEFGGSLTETFAGQLAARANGNPLVVWQYCQAMKDAGVLTPSWGSWVVDSEALATLALPADIYELLTSRINCLSEQGRRILTIAALLGPSIDSRQLSHVCENTPFKEVQGALMEGTVARLIERTPQGDDYIFVHDRVREAFLDQSNGNRPHIHRLAANYLDTLEGRSDRQTFERSLHFINGYGASQPRRTFHACLEAAELANAQHAYAKAYELLTYLDTQGCVSPIEPEAQLEFRQAIGLASFQTERVEEAMHHYKAALALTGDQLTRARLRGHIARAALFAMDTRGATREIELAFEALDRRLPSADYKDDQALQAHLVQLLRSSLAVLAEKKTFGSASDDQKAIFATIIDLADTGFLIGYYTRNRLFALQCGILGLTPAHFLGATPDSCRGLSTGALLLGLLGNAGAVEQLHAVAADIAGRIDDRQAQALVRSNCAIGRHFAGDVDRSLLEQREAIEKFGDWLGPVEYQNGCIDLTWHYFIRGYASEDLATSQAAIHRIETCSGAFMGGYVCRASASAMAAAATLGRMREAAEYFKEVERFVKIVPPDRTVPWVSVEGYRLHYYLQQEDFGPGFEAAIKAHEAWGIPPDRGALHAKHFYVCVAYARLELCLTATTEQLPDRLEQLRAASADLELAANVPTLVSHLKVIQANVIALEGDWQKAWELLNDAYRLSMLHDVPWALFEEARTRARLLRTLDRMMGMRHEARRAAALALHMGWRLRYQRVEREYQLHRDGSASSGDHSRTFSRTSVPTGYAALLKRQRDALFSLSRASASVLDPAVQARIALDESTRILGAERAFLFVEDETHDGVVFEIGRTATGEDLLEPSEYSRTIIDKVYATRCPILLSTRADAHAMAADSVITHDLRSVLAAPMMVGDRAWGVIYLDNRLARGIFDQDHVEILNAMGNIIATAMQTARAAQLEAQLNAEKERRKLAETLRALNQELTSTLVLNESLEKLVAMVSREIEFDRALVFIQDEDKLNRVVASGFPDNLLPDDYLEAALLEHLHEIQEGTLLNGSSFGVLDTPQSCMALPMRSPRDTTIRTGCVVLVRPAEKAFTEQELVMGMTLAEQASMAIENARLFNRVRTLADLDDLTGLYNRREFFHRAESLFAEARSQMQTLSAIMFDVDNFKDFNDNYGHAVGDDVLRLVAKVARQAIRASDVLGRYGGEEFAMLLPGANKGLAADVANRIRAAIAEAKLEVTRKGPVGVTVSVGVTERSKKDDLHTMLIRADQALYAAKRGGRNSVTVI